MIASNAAYKDYKRSPSKAPSTSASDLKNLLRGSGVLEFHILVTDPSLPEVAAMRERLAKTGPRPQARDTMEWVQADQPEEFEGRGGSILATYNGKAIRPGVSTQPAQAARSTAKGFPALERLNALYPAPLANTAKTSSALSSIRKAHNISPSSPASTSTSRWASCWTTS